MIDMRIILILMIFGWIFLWWLFADYPDFSVFKKNKEER